MKELDIPSGPLSSGTAETEHCNTGRPTMTHRWLCWSIRIGIGGLVLAAGAGKALDIPGFIEVIKTYRLGPVEGVLSPIALGIAGLEVVLGAWLLSGWRLPGAARLSMALNTGYFLLLTSALWRGLELANCGCFGAFLPSPLRWYSPLEDLALVGMSYLLLKAAKK